jgi:hypothetical protein
MTKLYVFWQDHDTRRWYPVGRLKRTSDSLFEFVYTRGAKDARGFMPFGRMSDLYKIYRSSDLFPIFANRILARSRQEYNEYIRWIGADLDPDNPMLILARTGGVRATDSLIIYAKPEPNTRNEFDLFFLCHGVRHLPEEAVERINRLAEGDVLYPMLDILNPFDACAVSLRTDDPVLFVGYVPRFFASDVRRCIQSSEPSAVQLRVARVSPEAPLQFRLLCRLTTPWPNDFEPCSGPEYEPLVNTDATARSFHSARAG